MQKARVVIEQNQVASYPHANYADDRLGDYAVSTMSRRLLNGWPTMGPRIDFCLVDGWQTMVTTGHI